MNNSLHPFTSIGSLTKKIMTINPDLSVFEVIEIVRQATQTQGEANDETSNTGIISEDHALELARATLNHHSKIMRL